jgi:hypothetical protein
MQRMGGCQEVLECRAPIGTSSGRGWMTFGEDEVTNRKRLSTKVMTAPHAYDVVMATEN